MAFGAIAPRLTAQGRRQVNEDFGRDGRSEIMRKFFEFGGVVAAVVLVAFGITAIVMGVNGRDTVSHSLKQEYIVGSPDMTPAGIRAEAKEAGLNVSALDIPSKSVANKPINTGDRARTFAGYMRIHALEASGGLTYAQMGRFIAKPDTPKQFTDGKGATSIDKWALLDPKTKRPVDNGARNVWVTETALTTALNTSYMADQLALFGIVVGVALLLSGIGFGILAIGGALRNPDTAMTFLTKRVTKTGGAPVHA
jgi:F0F1-type ATP synthase membrane subunit c/vacuolar-type H+-ATPase subunit K